MSIAALVALLSALLGFLNRVMPDKETPAQKTRDVISKTEAEVQAFEKTGDTTDLGHFN